VYYRGEGEIKEDLSCKVHLPEYVKYIASDFTVIVKPLYNDLNSVEYELNKKVIASEVQNNQFKVFANMPTKFNWIVHGKRFDLETEVDKDDKSIKICGDGPYKYLQKVQ
jgi:hypothetical protein